MLINNEMSQLVSGMVLLIITKLILMDNLHTVEDKILMSYVREDV